MAQDEPVEQEPKLADLLKKLEGLESRLERRRRPPRNRVQVKCFFCEEMSHYTRMSRELQAVQRLQFWEKSRGLVCRRKLNPKKDH